MKKIVLTFGTISGLISASMFLINIPLERSGIIDFDSAEILGYASMVLAFLLIFLGIRAYRRDHGNTISFGKGVQIGVLITLVASFFYVATWEVYYFNWGGDFLQKYSAHVVQKAEAEGKSPAEVAATRAKMENLARIYQNPLINVGMTFLEIFPVGVVMSLVSAALLRRKNPPLSAAMAA